ncbi:MAG: hypothetical protein MI757_02930 [Pirellulales bacterium]|nr:hypothetical protein [Pirellulales bacterium]
MTAHEVRHLLMGGQACMLYGAVQFSRDTDIVVLADQANIQRLTAALSELEATCIAVPPFEVKYLRRGHAIHFRSARKDISPLRIDVMSKLRGVDDFGALWDRRTTLQLDEGPEIHLMSLPDLVQAKKTQRLKDWPMLVRLVEVHYVRHREEPASDERIEFWLRECRTAVTLCELVARFPEAAASLENDRPLLSAAIEADRHAVDAAIQHEWNRQREEDREYWRPLMSELEQLRAIRRRN